MTGLQLYILALSLGMGAITGITFFVMAFIIDTCASSKAKRAIKARLNNIERG